MDSATSRLPEDVMREIFYAVATLEPAPGALLFYGVGRELAGTAGLQWMRLTHVCRSWRAIILGMVDLWGKVAFTFPSPMALPILLDRVQGADVDIVSKLHQRDTERTEKEAAYLPKARALSITSRANRRLLEYLTLKRMSQLRYLYLRIDLSDRLTVGAPIAAEHITDTEDILMDAPKLETLSLELRRDHVHPEPAATPGPAIRLYANALCMLTVRVDDYAILHVHPLEWIVALSRASPLLESLALSLSCQVAEVYWDTLLKGGSLRLPHLRRFIIEDSLGSYGHDVLARLCASPPSFLFASFGIFRGITPRNISPGDILDRANNFARSFGGYLCRDAHRALHIQLSSPNMLAVESMPTLDNPTALISRPILGKNKDPFTIFTEPADNTILHITTRPNQLANRFEWFGELADHVPQKDKIEQLYLKLHHNLPDPPERADICRERLLRPMTALHTLYLVNKRSFDLHGEVYWNGLTRLLCGGDGPVLRSLHTLLVRM